MIDNDLKCAACNKIFDSDPITLVPCGWVVCKKHFLILDKIECPICPTKHDVYLKQCVNTKNIQIKYMKYNLEENMKRFDLDLRQLNEIKKDPLHHINEFFSKIVNQIDLQREKCKLLVDNHFDAMLKRVKDAQNECEKKVDSNKNLNNFNDKDYREKIELIEQTVKQGDVNLEMFSKIEKYLVDVKDFDREINELKESLTDKKRYSLSNVETSIDPSRLFGKLKINSTDENDKINIKSSPFDTNFFSFSSAQSTPKVPIFFGNAPIIPKATTNNIKINDPTVNSIVLPQKLF